MKINSLLSTAGFFLVGSLLFISCSKDGTTGPAGEQGEQGPAGPTGATGTANVIYSAWLDIGYTADTDLADITDTLGYYSIITADKLSADIVNKGEVKVYCNMGNNPVTNPVIVPLPYFELYANGYISINPSYAIGKIQLYSNEDMGTFTLSTTGSTKYFQYRYVLIPGGTTARNSAAGAIDWNDYKQVQKYLGLKD